jgi:4-hydroxyphenylacetate 3-monooxygenase
MNTRAQSAMTRDFVVSKPLATNSLEPNLRSGQEYKESLRDGRAVILSGKDVEDVTSEPTIMRGIETISAYYDAQFHPETRDDLTSVDPETGQRFSNAWLVPYSKEDLHAHERTIRVSTAQTFGVFGRPPDYGSTKAISFVAWNHLISQGDPDALARIENFLEVGRRNNLLSADIVVDVQANRKLAANEMKGRLRVIEERSDGVVLSGAKAGNSAFAQGNIGTISMPPPAQNLPE